MDDLDPKGRFGNRVEAYRRARPGYPSALFDHLERRLDGLAGTAVADLGSGTGILTASLLERGCRVWAVEPNPTMRVAAERELGDRPGFVSVAGAAEDTGLEAGSIELATAAQAFHWFDLEPTGRELRRVLAPGGRVAVIWNDRRHDGAFHEAYERFLLEWATDYRAVRDSYAVADRLAGFLAADSLERVVFPNHQDLDVEGLCARLLSSSYLPSAGEPRADAMLEAARRLFEDHQNGGVVRLEYDCTLHLGMLAAVGQAGG